MTQTLWGWQGLPWPVSTLLLGLGRRTPSLDLCPLCPFSSGCKQTQPVTESQVTYTRALGLREQDTTDGVPSTAGPRSLPILPEVRAQVWAGLVPAGGSEGSSVPGPSPHPGAPCLPWLSAASPQSLPPSSHGLLPTSVPPGIPLLTRTRLWDLANPHAGQAHVRLRTPAKPLVTSAAPAPGIFKGEQHSPAQHCVSHRCSGWNRPCARQPAPCRGPLSHGSWSRPRQPRTARKRRLLHTHRESTVCWGLAVSPEDRAGDGSCCPVRLELSTARDPQAGGAGRSVAGAGLSKSLLGALP